MNKRGQINPKFFMAILGVFILASSFSSSDLFLKILGIIGGVFLVWKGVT